MAGSKPHTSAASIAERLQRLFQKLESWEALLEPRGTLDKDWQRRRQKLDELRQRLSSLRLRMAAPAFLEQSQNLQVPPLNICTTDEHLLYDQYLDAQLGINQQLCEQLSKVTRWVDEAMAASKSSWSMKLRLTKIRHDLSNLDHERQALEPHQIQQQLNWEKLADKFLLYSDQHSGMEDSRIVFEKVVRLTDSVKSLQQQVHASQNKVGRMEHWLKQATSRLTQVRAPTPPLAEDLRLAAQKVDTLGLEDLYRSKSRLAHAREYLENYLSQPDRPKPENAP